MAARGSATRRSDAEHSFSVEAELARVFGEGVSPLRFEEALCQAMLTGWARQQQSRRALVHDDDDLGPVARLVSMLDGYDLLVEPARLNGHVGAVMGLERELVLRARDGPWDSATSRPSPLCGSH